MRKLWNKFVEKADFWWEPNNYGKDKWADVQVILIILGIIILVVGWALYWKGV